MTTCTLCQNPDVLFLNYYKNYKNRVVKVIIYKFHLDRVLKFLSKKLYSKLTSGEEIFLNKKILICRNCNLGSIYPVIDEKTLNDYYSKNYWLSHGNISSGDTSIKKEEVKHFSEKIDYLKKYISFEGKNFAEFGSGRGILAYEILKCKKIKLYNAVEMSEISTIKELSVNNTFKKFNSIDHIEDNSIDAFIMIQSIEHLSDINKFFQNLKKKLKKQSIILIETPNYNKQYFKYRSGFMPHTLFFNKKSIKYLAKKFNFEIIDFQFNECPWSELNCGIKKEENEEGHDLRILLRTKS